MILLHRTHTMKRCTIHLAECIRTKLLLKEIFIWILVLPQLDYYYCLDMVGEQGFC